jgi:hypothetical protein
MNSSDPAHDAWGTSRYPCELSDVPDSTRTRICVPLGLLVLTGVLMLAGCSALNWLPAIGNASATPRSTAQVPSPATPTAMVGQTIDLPGGNGRVRVISLGPTGNHDTAHLLIWDPTRTLLGGTGDGDFSKPPPALAHQRWDRDPFLVTDPSDPSAVYVGWVGGMCDNWDRLEISPDGRRWTIYGGTPIGCELIGVGWYARLRFSRPVVPGRIVTDLIRWPGYPEPPEDDVALARVMTRSVVSPTVVRFDQGALASLSWAPVRALFPEASPQSLPDLASMPVVRIGLSGRYRSCNGRDCSVVPGTEDFLFTVEHNDLIAERHPS